jgi:hypothetical protein
MRKLMILLALLLAIGITVGSTPAIAIIRPPCNEICPDQPGSTLCTCEAGTPLAGRVVACSHWDWDCFYID